MNLLSRPSGCVRLFIAIVICTPPLRVVAAAFSVSALAGTPPNNYTDGSGSAVGLGRAAGITAMRDGSILIADPANYVIRRMSPSGVVSTFAGTPGVSGSQDGPVYSARFMAPTRMAIDPGGNIYVADWNTVRKITPDGQVSTIAGVPYPSGSNDGPAQSARFNIMDGIAVAGDGSVFVSDTGNATIRKIAPDGTVSTFAGAAQQTGNVDAVGPAARFYQPHGLAFDSVGNLYVADDGNATIRRISPQGTVFTFARGYPTPEPSGLPTGSWYDGDIAVDPNDNVYAIASTSVWKYRRDGSGSFVAGKVFPTWEWSPGRLVGTVAAGGWIDGVGDNARFDNIYGVCLDSSGNILVRDGETIRRIDANSSVATIAGLPGGSGWADGVGSAAHFYEPRGVAVDLQGRTYVADTRNRCIRMITPSGIVTTVAGVPGSEGHLNGTANQALFGMPYGVAVDAAGNVFVADMENCAIRKIDRSGQVSTVAGSATGYRDGPALDAFFNSPNGVAVANDGTLYVADSRNYVVRKISPSGIVSTLAGQPGVPGFRDGTGSDARFDYLGIGIAVGSDGTVYVCDSGNNAIRIISPNGVVKTLAGNGTSGELDGPGASATFYNPVGLTLDSSGNVYVTSDRLVRKITPDGVVTTLRTTLEPRQTDWSAIGEKTVLGGVALDPSGRFVVSDTYDDRVLTGQWQPEPGYLTNVSVRTTTAPGGQTLTIGFGTTGGTKPLLVRGIGPTLGAIGLPGALTNPEIDLYSGPNFIMANSAWGGGADLAATFKAVAAFPLDPASKDAAFVKTLDAGSYTVQVRSTGGPPSGITLLEVYDASDRAAAGNGRLINLSARAQVGQNDNILIAGFYVNGDQPLRVLVRAIGPTLGVAPFNVAGVLADPKLEIYRDTTLVASNDDWGGTSELSNAFPSCGAFPLPDGKSKDAALLVTLPPGKYTAQVSGVNGTTGIALVEVYEVPAAN